MDYFRAKSILDGRSGRWRDTKKLSNNTYLERRDGHIAVRLHRTDIVQFYPNGDVRLCTGGWETPTTKDRINLYCPGRVSSERGDWFFHYGGQTYAFESGLTIHGDGSVTGFGDLEAIYERWRESNRERGRRSYWIQRAKAYRWEGGRGDGHRHSDWRPDAKCYCGAVRVARALPKTRLTADDVMGESDYAVQEAKAKLFGHARLLAAIGEVREEDSDYQVLSFAFNHYRELVGLRAKADGTIALIKATTIKDGLFEALQAGFQKV